MSSKVQNELNNGYENTDLLPVRHIHMLVVKSNEINMIQ